MFKVSTYIRIQEKTYIILYVGPHLGWIGHADAIINFRCDISNGRPNIRILKIALQISWVT